MRRLAVLPLLVVFLSPAPAVADENAAVNVTVKEDCSVEWSLTNNSTLFRVFIVEANDGRVTVLSAGPGETTNPWTTPTINSFGTTYDYQAFTADLVWYSFTGDTVASSTVIRTAPPCNGTTTTTPPPTTTTTTTTPSPTTSTPSPTTSTTLSGEIVDGELPRTGLELNLAISALVAVLGGMWLIRFAADKHRRNLRRAARVWRR